MNICFRHSPSLIKSIEVVYFRTFRHFMHGNQKPRNTSGISGFPAMVVTAGIGLPSFSIQSNSVSPRSLPFCSLHARKADIESARGSPVQFPPAHQLNHFLQNPFRTRKTMKSAQGVLAYAEEAFLSLTKSRRGFSRKWWS
jgi:hypothetical protein